MTAMAEFIKGLITLLVLTPPGFNVNDFPGVDKFPAGNFANAKAKAASHWIFTL